MKLLDVLLGVVTVQVTAAQTEDFLNHCRLHGIRLKAIRPVDPTTLEVDVTPWTHRQVLRAAQHTQAEVTVRCRRGLPFFLWGFKTRLALLTGAFLLAVLTALGGHIILTVEVTGNETIPSEDILSTLRLCGVGTGTWGPSVPIRAVENKVMQARDDLTFFSLNLRGTKAQVIVRERHPGPPVTDETQPTNVIATADGILTHIEPWRGDPKFQEGDPIRQGDVLISGETLLDYPYLITEPQYTPDRRLVHADGRATARTWRTLTAQMDLTPTGKTYTGEETTRHALTIFGHRINFYKNSSIGDKKCDIIIRFNTWEPLEGRVLPITWQTETHREYTEGTMTIDPARAESHLQEALLASLNHLVAEGEVLQTDFTVEQTGDLLTVTLLAQSHEVVSRQVPINTEEKATSPTHPEKGSYGREESAGDGVG